MFLLLSVETVRKREGDKKKSTHLHSQHLQNGEYHTLRYACCLWLREEPQKYFFWWASLYLLMSLSKVPSRPCISRVHLSHWQFLCTSGADSDPVVPAVHPSLLLKLSQLKLLPSHLRWIKCTCLNVLNGHLELSLVTVLLLLVSYFSLSCKHNSVHGASDAFASWLAVSPDSVFTHSWVKQHVRTGSVWLSFTSFSWKAAVFMGCSFRLERMRK